MGHGGNWQSKLVSLIWPRARRPAHCAGYKISSRSVRVRAITQTALENATNSEQALGPSKATELAANVRAALLRVTVRVV